MIHETAKVALFGSNQSGKTLQIGNLIRAFGAANVGIVSCEDGLKTVASLIDPQHVRECNSLADLREAFTWARDHYAGADKWVCIDGGTRAMQWNAGAIWSNTDEAYCLMATGTPRAELPKNLKPYLRFITGQGEIDGQRQWVQIGRDADAFLNGWIKLDCNLYMTFWEDQSSIDQYRKGPPWQVDSPGKAGRDAVMGSFDFVMRLTREIDGKGVTHVIATHDPTRRVVRSKTRDDWNGGIKVPTEIPDFNLAQFVQTLRPQMAAQETR